MGRKPRCGRLRDEPSKLDDEVEKHQHLEELAELFLTVKTTPPTGTASRAHI